MPGAKQEGSRLDRFKDAVGFKDAAESGRFQDRFKDAGKKTEDAIGEASKAVAEAWSSMKIGSSWFGGKDSQRFADSGNLDRAPLAAYLASPTAMPPPVPVPGHPGASAAVGNTAYPPLQPHKSPPLQPHKSPPLQPHKSPPLLPQVAVPAVASTKPASPQWPHSIPVRSKPTVAQVPANAPIASLPPTPLDSTTAEDDIAMRHHFAALERLVAMGLSPQAARAALRNMDEWLTSKAGVATMANTEAIAREAGENVLHIGDHVCLEGLVKNSSANGKMAVLQTYVAESNRWKVALEDGKSYLLQSKFLRPVAQKPTAYLQQLEEVKASPSTPPRNSIDGSPTDRNSEAAMTPAHSEARSAEDEALRQQQAEEMRLQQEELARRADDLARTEEQLNSERVELQQKRKSLAFVQAHVASMLEKSEAGGEPKQHRIDDDDAGAEMLESTPIQQAEIEEAQSNPDSEEPPCDEEDDVWDMDWAAMGSASMREDGEVRRDGDPLERLRQDMEEGDDMEDSNHADTATADLPEAVSGGDDMEDSNHADTATADLPEAVSGGALSSNAPAPSPPEEAPNSGSDACHNRMRSKMEERRAFLEARRDSQAASPEEQAELQRILEEKHRLAECHNGEDHTSECRSKLQKESMPGAHPQLAEKLEEKRRRLELLEAEQHAVEDDAF